MIRTLFTGGVGIIVGLIILWLIIMIGVALVLYPEAVLFIVVCYGVGKLWRGKHV